MVGSTRSRHRVPSPPSSDDEDDFVPQIASPPQTPYRQRIMTQMNGDMAITLPEFSTLTLTFTPRRSPEITTDTRPSAPQTPTRSRRVAAPISSNPTSSRRHRGRSHSSATLSSTGSPITELSTHFSAGRMLERGDPVYPRAVGDTHPYDPVPHMPSIPRKFYVVVVGTKIGVFYDTYAYVDSISWKVGGFCKRADNYEDAKRIWGGRNDQRLIRTD